MARLVLAALLLLPAAAGAHPIGLTLLELVVRDRQVDLSLALHAQRLGGFDRDGDGVLDGAKVAASRERILEAWWGRIGFAAGGMACVRGEADVATDPPDGVRIIGTFRCSADPGEGVELRLDFLDRLPPDHRVVGEIRFGDRRQTFTLDANAKRIALRPQGAGGFGDYVLLGVEHIFTGFDHLLFLAGLLLVASRVGEIVRLVTSFTIAHSLTLSAAVLGAIELPASVVESMIAASIVVVAVENLVRRNHRGRVALTFAFGLVHGFGFAGLLRELGLGEGGVVLGLAGFNLGVELGQIAAVLAAAPLQLRARRRPWYVRAVVPGCSAAIAFFGAYWLVERLLG